MAQFAVYRNKSPSSKASIPYLLDVQSDLLSKLGTRVVVPLFEKKALGIKPLIKLTPEFEIDGKTCVLMTPQLAGIPTKELGEPVGDLAQHRTVIIAALDLLIAGF
jgi:toxin CcdB